MAIVTIDEKDYSEQVYKELKAKVSVEVPFERQLNGWIAGMVRDLKAENNTKALKKKHINIENDYYDELAKILSNNYKKASAKAVEGFQIAFGMDAEEALKKLIDPQTLQHIEENSIKYAQKYSDRRVTQIAPKILETTVSDLKDSYNTVDKLIQEQGLSLGADERDSMAYSLFEEKAQGRNVTRAMTEVQNVYQNVKQYQAKETAKELSRQGQVMQKRWDATLDEKTRPAHAMAHGQRQNVDDLFFVGGEYMMYPGDMGNGASLSNTINCRCEVIYILVQPE